jgi:hypothetical protein
MSVATVALALSLVVSAQAGVYNPSEPDSTWTVQKDFRDFQRAVRARLRQFGTVEGQEPVHYHYDLIASLAPRLAGGKMSLHERLSLSAYLIRARKYQEAADLLKPALRLPEGRGNFLLSANLAMAEYLNSKPFTQASSPDLARRARDYLADAIGSWPKEWSRLGKAQRATLEEMGWTEKQFLWYRKVENALLRLLTLRARERQLPPGKVNRLGDDVEPLFEGGTPPRPVRWVGPSGKYEAGKLAEAEAKKLPEDAIDIVQQLLIWMPDDPRLFWLLGELYNARGDYAFAYEIFAELGRSEQQGAKASDILFGPPKGGKKGGPPVLPQLPRGEKQTYPELPAVHRSHWLVIRDAKQKADKQAFEVEPAKGEPAPPPLDPRPPKKPPDKRTTSADDVFPIDLRSLGVGFGAGVIVAIFGYWQLREIRRRRQTRAPAPPGDAGRPWSGPKDAIAARPPEGPGG